MPFFKNNGYSLNCGGKLIVLDTPKVMGILNVTDDSFYKGSRVDLPAAIDMAGTMLEAGATFLDIGGQSTRPGAPEVSNEADRVLPVIEGIKKAWPEAALSIDTYHAHIAKMAVEAGAVLVNDISAGRMDENMLSTVAVLKVPYIAMHMQGTPLTMQAHPTYGDVTREVIQYLAEAAEKARNAGIKDVLVDPGFGFGKNKKHNYALLKNLDALQILQRPVVVGLSRKSLIYRTLEVTPGEALNGTTVLHTLALTKGAHILRVHDVKEAMEAIRLLEIYLEA
jgi:dihydropteroate synthase